MSAIPNGSIDGSPVGTLVVGVIFLLVICGLPHLLAWAVVQVLYKTKEERDKAWRRFLLEYSRVVQF